MTVNYSVIESAAVPAINLVGINNFELVTEYIILAL
mgnify:FL=1